MSSTEQLSNTITQYKLLRLSRKPILIPSPQSNLNYRIKSNQPPPNLEELVEVEPKEFSIYGHDIDRLNVQVSISGTDMIRLTIRDAEKDRYEVPVPIHWQPAPVSSSTKARIQFEMTKTSNGQAGFRVRRTDTRTIIFDTSYFAHGFIYDDQYVQLITTIPSRNVYGKTLANTHLFYILQIGRFQSKYFQDSILKKRPPFFYSAYCFRKEYLNVSPLFRKFVQLIPNRILQTFR